MARISAEEKKLAETIKRLPFKEEDIARWDETLNSAGLSEELAQELQTALAALPRDEDAHVRRIAQATIQINNLVRRWRLGQNLRHSR